MAYVPGAKINQRCDINAGQRLEKLFSWRFGPRYQPLLYAAKLRCQPPAC